MPMTKRISRIRKELLSKYATAAVLLYGVIEVSEFVEVFNFFEDKKTDAQEINLALERLAKTDDVEYSLFGDLLLGPSFLPEFPEGLENAKSVRTEQKGKPRYLPEKDEFLRYVKGDYREPEQPYADVKAYILKNKLSTKGEGISGIDGDLIDLHEMIQSGVNTNEYLAYFTKAGYKYKSIDELNSFMQVLMNVHNNTRLFENNGFTPNEIFEEFRRQKLFRNQAR